MANYATPLNTLTVNGTNLYDEFGVYVSGTGRFTIPEKDVEMIEIPGVSGDLILAGKNKRTKNVTITYPCFIIERYNKSKRKTESFVELMTQLQDFFMELPEGYVPIEDTYQPNEYRMGVFIGSIDPTVSAGLDGGTFELSFSCEPKRYKL